MLLSSFLKNFFLTITLKKSHCVSWNKTHFYSFTRFMMRSELKLVCTEIELEKYTNVYTPIVYVLSFTFQLWIHAHTGAHTHTHTIVISYESKMWHTLSPQQDLKIADKRIQFCSLQENLRPPDICQLCQLWIECRGTASKHTEIAHVGLIAVTDRMDFTR